MYERMMQGWFEALSFTVPRQTPLGLGIFVVSFMTGLALRLLFLHAHNKPCTQTNTTRHSHPHTSLDDRPVSDLDDLRRNEIALRK